ncbi:hypothetical protein HPB48_022620 [Haemaphysalis longicornis]|uniref:Uncharacterized protein n=1 Tax=Haemaphysalis longicornis TaxID=44386 RepID=A0A9J6GKM8_HAELO|nr:hypothetical protein HPB48_022620 [Haemaphysalis longicornis]
MDIAIALIKAETAPRSKRLRQAEVDSDEEDAQASETKRGKVTALPPDDVRYDMGGGIFPSNKSLDPTTVAEIQAAVENQE